MRVVYMSAVWRGPQWVSAHPARACSPWLLLLRVVGYHKKRDVHPACWLRGCVVAGKVRRRAALSPTAQTTKVSKHQAPVLALPDGALNHCPIITLMSHDQPFITLHNVWHIVRPTYQGSPSTTDSLKQTFKQLCPAHTKNEVGVRQGHQVLPVLACTCKRMPQWHDSELLRHICQYVLYKGGASRGEKGDRG